MVNAELGTVVTLITVTVSVLAFFTVSATRQVADFEPGILKLVTSLSLMLSYVLLFWVGFIMIASEVFRDTPVLFSALKLIFAVFVIPEFLLVWKPLVDMLKPSWKSLTTLRKQFVSVGAVIWISLIHIDSCFGNRT